MSIAVLALTPGGAATARRIAALLAGARVHGLAKRLPDADESFDDVATHAVGLFRAGRAIVGVCAAGVLIRALAPALADKRSEPPVLAVAEDGSVVVPLLGGHRGGNDLARRIAGHLGGVAAVTTAGDLRFGVALDEPPPGWTLANPGDAKGVMAALLSGAGARIEGDAGWLRRAELPAGDDIRLVTTDMARKGDARTLVYHARRLAVGIGCERGAEPAEAVALARRALADAGLAAGAVGAVVSIDLKADEPAVHAVAADLGTPARFFSAARLEEETPRLANPSDSVFREVGCHGVAEGAALAAAGAEGALVVPKTKSKRVTCAVARAPIPLDAALLGRARGRLAVVGIGPGPASWRAPEADAEIRRATDLIGYRLYLDLLGPAADGKRRHAYTLGEEQARVRAALDLAAEGRAVALVSSGDAGIYGMAALVFELVERERRADWSRVEVSVIPGISALQAVAARAGAPLGHDFAAVSLSDLLTPWEVIRRRLEAVAAGDFVVAFYNPVSKRRRTQLAEAKAILLGHRLETTPVVVGRNVGRVDETVEVTTLGALDVAAVDMLSLVLVGAAGTRSVPRAHGRPWVYTPRGYAAKGTPR